ncbi:5'-methylthioadenosine/adenosylhomocysteine nucleosidase [Oceanivirga salmonicida]|uniref:5'-methylthioadenosine/adenosylhomocysteine nucleosidase n=1 Tax=Oceanivirga salmonicida TaxID=1769291 RepID=UPI000832D57F|nr:5'-methylthioadenosine/adenosylhomocysteine nucleosidase [Oceanivirga salmonicida]
MIGIIGAMDSEVSVIVSEMTNVTVENLASLTFYKGTCNNKEIVIVKSGIGMVNASIATTLLYERFKVEKIIFSGVAGSTVKDIKALDIVIGNSFVEYMFDVTLSGKYVKGQIAGTSKRDIDPSYDLLEITKDIKLNVNIHYGRIASADVFVNDYDEKIRIKNEFDAVAVDMESAAVAQTCTVLKIPYLIIRSISDSLGDNSNIEFSKFENLASINSKEFLLKLLKRL